jgi:hypothetical protein
VYFIESLESIKYLDTWSENVPYHRQRCKLATLYRFAKRFYPIFPVSRHMSALWWLTIDCHVYSEAMWWALYGLELQLHGASCRRLHPAPKSIGLCVGHVHLGRKICLNCKPDDCESLLVFLYSACMWGSHSLFSDVQSKTELKAGERHRGM